ncbi:hypothetical protein [Archaeoglobus veneficus]|uniref:Uncharacterized protein n=1 Tax=Archaeoglobus veneficus (strain DSM 11195 / SNP6) TaxID=693661 RepID=F2KRB0_ARCVS|nr:hypothetical protein [Archaeoglobus veneficus]AEA47844.1 hypothetical protein Arcve_1849 [Archaeoglobus veneficus SNP6]
MDEKKIIDVLMDDDTFIIKKNRVETSGSAEESRQGSVESERRVEKREEKEEKVEKVEKGKEERVDKKDVKAEYKGEPEIKGKDVFLSEIERSVLRSVVFEAKEPRMIARLTGYPEVVVRKALERLIEKGYLTEELEPTEKVSEVRWLRPVKVSVKYGRSTKLVAMDVAIVVAALIFLLSLLYYLGII